MPPCPSRGGGDRFADCVLDDACGRAVGDGERCGLVEWHRSVQDDLDGVRLGVLTAAGLDDCGGNAAADLDGDVVDVDVVCGIERDGKAVNAGELRGVDKPGRWVGSDDLLSGGDRAVADEIPFLDRVGEGVAAAETASWRNAPPGCSVSTRSTKTRPSKAIV